MTSALRAPELSAILRIDSCCTMGLSSLLGALEDLDHPPPLGPGEGPGLLDAHGIARLGALLVVRGDLLGAHHLLAVEAVREAADQGDRDGLLHLVAHHHAGPRLATPPHAFFSRKMV